MQCSAPGLKNARRRLTIRPPLVPTTETAKPILKQRKPPAVLGPGPFKNAGFSNLIIFFEIKKKNRPTAERVCSRRPDLLLAAAAAASFSLLRARPRRSLWRGSRGRPEGRTRARGRASAAGARGGRALVAVRPPHAGGARSACPGGAWSARSRGEPAGGAARIPPPAGAACSSEHARSTRSCPGRGSPRGEGVSARRWSSAHPTMAASAGNRGCTAAPRGLAGWHA